jgi:hypothetical protein
MAEDQTVKTALEWSLKDKVSSGLHKIAEGIERLRTGFEHLRERGKEAMEKMGEGAERVSRSLSKVTEIGMGLAGLAGGIGFERMIDTGKESLEQLKKMSELADMSADSVAGWRDAFEQSGLQVETFSRSLTALSKKTLSMEEGSKQLVLEARRWGVTLNEGPSKALLSMSKAVQANKIGVGEVSKYMRVSGEEAGALMGLLKKGPDEIQEMVKHAQQLNVHLAGGSAIEAFERFHEASQKISEAWRRISEKVVVRLAPALERISSMLAGWLDKIDIDKVVNPLIKGFELAIAHAKTLGKIMLANSLLEKLPGGAGGLVGTGRKVFGAVVGAGGRLGGLLGRGLGGAVGLGAQVAGEAGLGGLGGVMGKVAGVLPMLMKLIGSAAGIGLVVGAVMLVVKHFDYFKEKLGGVATAIWGAIQKIVAAVGRMFSADAPLGRFVRWIGEKTIAYTQKLGEILAKVLEVVAQIFDWLNSILDKLPESLGGNGGRMARNGEETAFSRMNASVLQGMMASPLGGQFRAAMSEFNAGHKLTAEQVRIMSIIAKQNEMAGSTASGNNWISKFRKTYEPPKKAEDATAGRANVIQDFRGSHFDIEQKFEDGFDPDRIAVSFANDLGSLGERKMVSTLGPQFIR